MRFRWGSRIDVLLPYNPIIRVNADVPIRRSTWLVETMNNPSVDGISLEDASADIVPAVGVGMGNHEMAAAKEVHPIIDANQNRRLPENAHSNRSCRVRGGRSSVAHNHGAVSIRHRTSQWFAIS